MNTPVNPLDPQTSPAPAPPTPFKFSPEDQRILKECNREAFYKRCLPYSAGFGGLIYMAVKAGYLKGHVSWGPAPKVMAAVFLGYFAGKLSYQQTCAEKLMNSPNSQIGAALRARRRQGGGGFQDTAALTLDLPGLSLPEESAASVYRDDLAHGTFNDLDTDRPHNLDDAYQAGFDSPQEAGDFILPPQASTPNSYEEMRKKNREDFDKKTRTYRAQEEQQRQYSPPQQPSPPSSPDSFDRYKPTNAYGDVFEK